MGVVLKREMSMDEARAVLEGAAGLIERTGWTQGAQARMADGFCCDARAPWAVEFCARGALLRAAHDAGFDQRAVTPAMHLLSAAIPTAKGYGVTSWNDRKGRKASTVVRALRRAAKSGEGRP